MRSLGGKNGSCKICRHKHRAQIENLVIGGASQRSVGERFGVDKDSLSRHFKAHVTRERKAALLAGPARVHDLVNMAAEESKSVLEYLSIARGVIFNQFLTAAEVGDRNGVAHIGGRLIDVLRELGRLTGELREVSGLTINQTNNIAVFADPKFLALQSGLLAIARAHPGSRADIVALLRGLDAKPDTPLVSASALIEGGKVEDAA